MRKDIKLSITYQGNLKPLKHDITELDGIRNREGNRVIKVPVRLDLSGIKSDAVKAAQAYHSEFSKATKAGRPTAGGGGFPGGGSFYSASLAGLRDQTSAMAAELKRQDILFENSARRRIKSFEQLQRVLASAIAPGSSAKGVDSKAFTVPGRARAMRTGGKESSDQDLDRSLVLASRYHDQQRQILLSEERQANLLKNRAQREQAINSILARRAALLQSSHNTVSDVHAEASRRGNHAITNKAESTGGKLASQGIQDMDRLAVATGKSTYSNSFHSSSLLRNAASYAKWGFAMTAVTVPLAAIGSGVRNAIELERTFKTLESVFRGSKEDARQLAQQTLLLAAANGRGGKEAADAAIAWSRLGLTRTQVLLATETSLRAANVAEITAAEATAYLTASYKGFHQSILDIPATLDYLNSLSNGNAASVKNMFDAISRGGKVASDAGLSLERYAAIAATVAESGVTGSQFGNAFKTITNKIARPATLEKLKSGYDLDFTTPAGGIQQMDDILLKLSETYHKLGTEQGLALATLVAGSNQSNRAATMLDKYTDSLIAQFVAMGDSNSAARENAKILSSVDSGMQMVATAWDNLVLSLANTGAFEGASNVLQKLSSELQRYSEWANAAANAGGQAAPEAKKYGMSEATARKVTRTSSRGVESVVKFFTPGAKQGDATNPTKEELENYLDLLGAFGTNGDISIGRKQRYTSNLGQYNDAKALGSEGRATVMEEIRQALAKGVKDAPVTPGIAASRVLESEKRIKQFNSGQQAFQTLSREAMTDDPRKILTSFEKMRSGFSDEIGGAKEFEKLQNQVRPMLEGGDRTGASKFLGLRADQFAADGRAETATLEAKRPEYTAITQSAIESKKQAIQLLERESAAAAGNAQAQQKIGAQTQRLEADLKSLTEAYNGINRAAEAATSPQRFSAASEDLDRYVSGLKLAGDVFGEMIEGFGNTGFSDLDTKLKIGGALLQGDFHEQSIASQRKAPGSEGYNPTEDAKLEGELEALRKSTREETQQLELSGQSAKLIGIKNDSSDLAQARLGQFSTGRTQGEQLSNTTSAALAGASRDIQIPTAQDPLNAARQLGDLTGNLIAAKSGVLAMERRSFDITKEKSDLEMRITDQLAEQNRERSKGLAMADRGDQLRVAAFKSFTNKNGPVSMQEFQYMSSDTRRAVSSFAPETVKGLDDTERDNNKARSILDKEFQGLSVSLASFKQHLAGLLPQAAGKVGELASRMGPTPAKEDTPLSKENLKLEMKGNVNVQIQVSTQAVADIVTAQLKPYIDKQFGDFARSQNRFAVPDTSAAAGVR